MLEIPQCIGAKHSSLSRRAEWDRLALRDEVRPDFRVFTGNDLAIDMVMYGSDYLLGLSTFAPDAFAERDRCGRRAIPAFYELNDVLQYLGQFAFRDAGARLPARRRDVPRAARLGGQRRDPAGRAPPARRPTAPCSPTSPRASDVVAAVRITAGQEARRRVDALRAHLDALGVDIPVDAEVDPDGVLSHPSRSTTAAPAC